MNTITSLDHKNILVTGAAGFIGAGLVQKLLSETQFCEITGIDSLNDYYDPQLKKYRLALIDEAAAKSSSKWHFVRGNIADREQIRRLFCEHSFDIVVHLAAQAGVRYSVTNPDVYIESNLIGFYSILEACRHSRDGGAKGVEHLIYASSSSVYGENRKVPFCTEDNTDHPVSLYAATKKSNELLAHAYARLYGIPCTGLRFFTVYGPAGRPDMAYFGFTDKLRKGDCISIFNYGNCKRDFTFIDDIVEGVSRVMRRAPGQTANGVAAPYALYNIGCGRPQNLTDFVRILSEELVRADILPADFDLEAHKKFVPMQPGDVPVTYADTGAFERDFGPLPGTDLASGLRAFAKWYKVYYQV